MDDLLGLLTGGGSLVWTLVCVLALMALCLAIVRLAGRTRQEERELEERLAAYRRALDEDGEARRS